MGIDNRFMRPYKPQVNGMVRWIDTKPYPFVSTARNPRTMAWSYLYPPRYQTSKGFDGGISVQHRIRYLRSTRLISLFTSPQTLDNLMPETQCSAPFYLTFIPHMDWNAEPQIEQNSQAVLDIRQYHYQLREMLPSIKLFQLMNTVRFTEPTRYRQENRHAYHMPQIRPVYPSLHPPPGSFPQTSIQPPQARGREGGVKRPKELLCAKEHRSRLPR